MKNKSSVREIKARFDQDVERFSNLETGQISTIDAEISLELITSAAKAICPDALNILDVGCGAGNYTLKMLTKIPHINCTLIDLSPAMLERANQRVSKEINGKIQVIEGDIRDIELEDETFEIILAGAVLHHLRDDDDWQFVFTKLFNALTTGGCLMISDLIAQDTENITKMIWEKYGDYLEKNGGHDYRTKVLDYIEKEDSPRSLNYQIELMKKVGFRKVEILHKNLCFAAFGGIK